MSDQNKKPQISVHQGDSFIVPNDVMVELLRETLSRGAAFHFRAKGMSMHPFIKDGDFITIVPSSRLKPSIGRIVAYTQPGSGSLIVHRIVSRKGDHFLIQGDNTGVRPFDNVPMQNIMGCVTRVERSGRRVRCGLGLERLMIAFLTRVGCLARLKYYIGRIKERCFKKARLS